MDGLWDHVKTSVMKSYFEYNWDSLPGTDFYNCYGFNMMIS